MKSMKHSIKREQSHVRMSFAECENVRATLKHMSVLIQASMPFRVERVSRKQNMTEDEARKTIEKVDRMRENYVKKYAKTSRYDTRAHEVSDTLCRCFNEGGYLSL